MKKFIKFISISLFMLSTSCQANNSISLDEEAEAQGKKFFGNKILECRGKHYIRSERSKIIELDNLVYVIKKEQLTESDKKNGISWKGSIILRPSVYRRYEDSVGWGKYNDWEVNGSTVVPMGINISSMSVDIIKLNNNWYFNEDPFIKNQTYNYKKEVELPNIEIKCDLSFNSMSDQLAKIEEEKREKLLQDENIANKSAISNKNLGKYILTHTYNRITITSVIEITDIGFKYYQQNKGLTGSYTTGYRHCWFGALESIAHDFDGRNMAYHTLTKRRNLNLPNKQADTQFFSCGSYEFLSNNEEEVKSLVDNINNAYMAWKKNNQEVYNRKLYPKNPKF